MLGKEGSKDFVKKGMLLLSSISLYVLSFPSPGYYPLAWFCLVPLLGLLSNTSIKHAFLIGWIFGCLTNLIVAHWVFYATFRYSDISPWMSFLFPFLLLGVIFGLYFAIFAVGANYLLGSGLNKTIKMLGIASLWTVLEFCKAYLFSGLPWQLLGYSQYKATSIIQISDFTGVYG
ncbi:hypothetical protein KJ966_06560, partial [bacterium]|nr:hypothetical protein [bacterium]